MRRRLGCGDASAGCGSTPSSGPCSPSARSLARGSSPTWCRASAAWEAPSACGSAASESSAASSPRARELGADLRGPSGRCTSWGSLRWVPWFPSCSGRTCSRRSWSPPRSRWEPVCCSPQPRDTCSCSSDCPGAGGSRGGRGRLLRRIAGLPHPGAATARPTRLPSSGRRHDAPGRAASLRSCIAGSRASLRGVDPGPPRPRRDGSAHALRVRLPDGVVPTGTATRPSPAAP